MVFCHVTNTQRQHIQIAHRIITKIENTMYEYYSNTHKKKEASLNRQRIGFGQKQHILQLLKENVLDKTMYICKAAAMAFSLVLPPTEFTN